MLSEGARLSIALLTAAASSGVAIAVVGSIYSPVRPVLVCVKTVTDRTATAWLGWDNVESETLELPVGEYNRFSPGPADRGQPTRFEPGRAGGYPRDGIQVTFEGESLTWRLGGREVTVTRESAACPTPATLDQLEPMAFVLPRTPPPEPPKPPEPPPKPPEPPPEPVAAKPDAAKEPTREAKNHIEKAGQPKPKKPRPKRDSPADAPKSEPAPLVLSGLTKLEHGVGVQSGDVDLLGDSRVAATERNTNVELVDDPDNVPDKVGDGTGGVGPGGPARTPPRVKTRVRGVYPEDAPRLGRTVSVSLSLLVGTDGRVKQVKVVRGAGGAFDREATKVGRQITFTPGTVGGEPTEQWVPWVVEFTPDDW